MRLIDADELVEKLCKEYRMKGAKQVKSNFMNYIYDAPAVDANPVVHGRWNKDICCTACGASQIILTGLYIDATKWKYCPNCGAKMDLQEES